MEIGDAESGIAAQVLGPIRAVLFGGCIALLLPILAWFGNRQLREERLTRGSEHDIR
jgi:hypothetical protein